MHDFKTIGVPDIESNRSLAAVGEGQREIDTAALCTDALTHQAAIRVTFRRLYVHDLGAPVGKKCPRNRNEHPLCQLQDADAIERLLTHFGPQLWERGDNTTTGMARSVRD